MVANTKPAPGIPISGARDASNGPVCGDCISILLTKQYPLDGTQCPMCKRVWFAHAASLALKRHLAYKVKCTLCNERWLEGEGHICPELPTPRRREAIYATRKKL